MKKKLHQSVKFKNKINHLQHKLLINSHYIYADENGSINSRHLETIRILSNRKIKKIGGKFVICMNPNTPLTKKSLGVRMGKGKGPFREYIFFARQDDILFEFRNVPKDLFLSIYRKIKYKFPIKIKPSHTN